MVLIGGYSYDCVFIEQYIQNGITFIASNHVWSNNQIHIIMQGSPMNRPLGGGIGRGVSREGGIGGG